MSICWFFRCSASLVSIQGFKGATTCSDWNWTGGGGGGIGASQLVSLSRAALKKASDMNSESSCTAPVTTSVNRQLISQRPQSVFQTVAEQSSPNGSVKLAGLFSTYA